MTPLEFQTNSYGIKVIQDVLYSTKTLTLVSFYYEYKSLGSSIPKNVNKKYYSLAEYTALNLEALCHSLI